MILSPQFWEWFNVWLVHILKILYHETKMVALRESNSVNPLSQTCGHASHAGQPSNIEGVQTLQATINMPQSVAPHLNINQINLQPLNNISVHFLNNPNSVKNDHSSRFSNPNRMQQSHHYRAMHQTRTEYATGGAGGAAAYLPAGAAGPVPGAPNSMRVQQQQQPPQQQQDLSKTNMAPLNFGPAPPQPRPQYSNFNYRAAQHQNRPNSHPRQQQYIASGAATGSASVMYPTLVFGPTVSYQQPRSQGYYQYMAPYIPYNTPNHTPPYFFPSGSGQLAAPNMGGGGGARAGGGLVPPPAPVAPAAPAPSLPHAAPPPPHLHQTLPPTRPPMPKRSHRVPIIHPVTNQEITTNETQASGESSERQTPQPQEPTPPPTNSIAEEFSRMVNEAAKEPSDSTSKSNYTKNTDTFSTASNMSPQTNAITSNNNNLVKSDILNINENKNLGPDNVVEPSETPVVSALSNSPVIVPKLPTNTKQKNSDQNAQLLVVDSNKNIPPNKKHNKNKPIVPQVEDAEPCESVETPAASAVGSAPPQPQRVPRERVRPESRDAATAAAAAAATVPAAATAVAGHNGPALPPVSNTQEVVNTLPSQASPESSPNPETVKECLPESDVSQTSEINIGLVNATELEPSVCGVTKATDILATNIDKSAKEVSTPQTSVDLSLDDLSSAIEAQTKLTQSIASCIKPGQPESEMKDINLNKISDTDTANGNTTTVSSNKEDINRNEKAAKNSKNMNKKVNKTVSSESAPNDAESCENGKEETDINSKDDSEKPLATPEEGDVKPSVEVSEPVSAAPPAPKYKYGEDQWSPFNTSGRKCYDLGLLKQIREDSLSKSKPDIPLLESLRLTRETQSFTPISRPINDSLLPSFAKPIMVTRSTSRDPKKDGRNMSSSGRGSVKLTPNPSGSGHKPVIHVSLSLRDDVKLNQTANAWKPTRHKKDAMTEEDYKTEDLFMKFRGILNKLTPQKFDTLMEKAKLLDINNQKRLQGVIDLVFEKAIDEPNFSEAYALMCNKLSKLMVPADNAVSPDQYVHFKGLIISRCQSQFETYKVDEQVLKLEKELTECTDPAKKKELQLQLEEENRRIRMRSVGNIRFIGELYKLKMLTPKIMVYCMNRLIDVLEEEKLECLCKLLTTIGEQIESENKESLDTVFKKMQDIVSDRKSNKISSRVRFMIQDVIELRRRKWVAKNVVDLQPKMMDQIQKEAEQHQRHIELMNSTPMGGGGGGGFRRDEGGRGKRGDGRRQGNVDNNWKIPKPSYSVDAVKFRSAAATANTKISNIKLAPSGSAWNCGSGAKSTAMSANNAPLCLPTATTNMYSVLDENVTDPPTLRGNKDHNHGYHSKGASIERSTFNSRGDFSSGGRGTTMGVSRSQSGGRSGEPAPPTPAPPAPAPPVAAAAAAPIAAAAVAQEPLTDKLRNSVQSTFGLYLQNDEKIVMTESIMDVKELFKPQHHAAVVTEVLNYVLEKSPKDMDLIAKIVTHLVSTNTISAENFITGMAEILEAAPDLYIDIPMLYVYLSKFFSPLLEKKYVSFADILKISDTIISAKHGHLFLKSLITQLKESMGPSFVKNKWQESNVELKQWMSEDQINKFVEDNKFEFLGGATASEEITKILTPAETQKKLLQLMNSDENCECIRGWVQDNLGAAANEEWFMRALVQAVCEHALWGAGARDVPHFRPERMSKYAGLLHEFGDNKQAREASCLFGIQQLIHRLQHPQGLTLEIFQYLHEQYIISVESFIAWQESEKEPEGKAVMLKVLTSFFTSIQEADNEDSSSED